MWYIGTKDLCLDENCQKIVCGKYTALFNNEKRFVDDKLFFETDRYLILLDGIVLNKSELTKGRAWTDAIESLLEHSDFPDMLRGSFSGAFLDKAKNEVYIFTNHSGERQAFFYKDEKGNFIATSDFNLLRTLKNNGAIQCSIYENALRYLLSYGFMVENCTCYNEVKRLMPGEILCYGNDGITARRYHTYTNTKVFRCSDEEAIEKIDALFRNALKREFDKDREYGLRHIVDLSGGLDCRVVNYVAKAMGYKDILNISYSQVGSNEYKAMLAMSKDLEQELLFYPLNSASFIFDVDKITNMNFGLCIYATSTGLSKILSCIDRTGFGIEHGGLMGDIRDGAFPGPTYYQQKPAQMASGMQFSSTAKLKVGSGAIETEYENQEMYDIFTRGFLGGLSTQMIRRNFGEYFAPYMDPDFYDFFLSLPLDQRVERKILQKWVKQCYPQALKIVDDKFLCRIDANKAVLAVCKFKTKAQAKIDRFGMKHNLFYRQNSMNPFDFWYKTNRDVRDFILDYYKENESLLNGYPEMKEAADRVMQAGTTRDKTMVLSVLSTLKQYS